MPEIDSGALPVFARVAVCEALEVPTTAEKLRDAGVRLAMGAVGITPVPLNATCCGDPVALSVTVSTALKAAAVAGVKVTAIEQFEPAASELPQVLVWAKLEAFVPVMAMVLMLNAALPAFDKVTV